MPRSLQFDQSENNYQSSRSGEVRKEILSFLTIAKVTVAGGVDSIMEEQLQLNRTGSGASAITRWVLFLSPVDPIEYEKRFSPVQ